MKGVVIIGAGGHAREVAEIIQHRARDGAGPPVLGFVVDAEYLDAAAGGPQVLGDWSWFEGVDCGGLAVVCAVGAPPARKRLAERAAARGLTFASAVSPLAYLSPGARLGRGVMIFPHAFASAGCLIDDHAVVNVGASVSHDARVGRYATLGPGARLAGHASVGEGAYLGVGAGVIDRVSVGGWATVGAGAVVTRDLPGDVTAVGVPARVIENGGRERHERATGGGGG